MKVMASEAQVLSSVCEYLALKQKQNKLMFFRNNTIPVYDSKRGAYRALPKYAIAGNADVIVVLSGWAIFVECKATKGRLSPAQMDFQRLVEKNGAEYIVVRSIDDLVEHGL